MSLSISSPKKNSTPLNPTTSVCTLESSRILDSLGYFHPWAYPRAIRFPTKHDHVWVHFNVNPFSNNTHVTLWILMIHIISREHPILTPKTIDLGCTGRVWFTLRARTANLRPPTMMTDLGQLVIRMMGYA